MFDKTLDLIERGREGKSIRIPFPFERLSDHVGISPHIYFLVGGESGTGKSSFAHQVFILHPYEWLLDNPDTLIKFKSFIWVLERPKEYIIAKWICQRLWKKYNILVDVPDILSWRANRLLDDDVYKKILEMEEYFQGLFKHVKIIDVRNKPSEIFKLLRKWARKNGKEYDKSGEEITDLRLKKENPIVCKYKPDDPNLITLVMTDHIGLLSNEGGKTDKQNIDIHSSYSQILRDRYGFCCVDIQQFNRGLRDTTRRVKLVLQPERSDFEGSSNPFQNADVVIGLLNPYEYNLKEYLNYKINSMVSPDGYNRFRTSILMKNSYGIADVHAGYHFIGESGYFSELPRPSRLSPNDYYNLANLPSAVSYMPGRGGTQDSFDFDGLEFD